MLLSIALIIMTALFSAKIFKLLNLPPIIGMLLSGIILGPYALDLIDDGILNIAVDLRQMALIVILFRAGLSLHLEDLKIVGKKAILLSFIPATIEMLVIFLLAPIFFDMTYIESLMLGTVVAAVSPAIVVPRMIERMKEHYGTHKKIPHLILASASIDDIFVIIMFMASIQLYQGSSLSLMTIIHIPLSIILGSLLGIMSGFLHIKIFKLFHMRDTVKVLWIFSLSFLMIVLEHAIKDVIPISGLISVMVFGISLKHYYPKLADRLHVKFEKIWVIAEIMLFVLVGAVLNITIIPKIGIYAVMLIILALLGRVMAVFLALLKSNLSSKERLFVAFSYLPKATVQAAIGAIPLSLGVPMGDLILSIAVLSILITAPLGAYLMDRTYQKLLTHDI
ncbi:MAG: potassium transporter [Tenericutes bacterium HGW-Tenericutes-6]|jgi:NhaP-type Na+/H+ or K+/H+ antiporter|nr:MAG: potassium transporter [Tenericutes bacterium HGW-Tenericutes-6]